MAEERLDKTLFAQERQYQDRWDSLDLEAGIEEISERLSPEELRQFEIFEPYSDKFLGRISPDLSRVVWSEDSVLFEEGTYIDLAFFIVSGEVDVLLQQVADGSRPPAPIFDDDRTFSGQLGTHVDLDTFMRIGTRPTVGKDTNITFLSTMDFNLARGETRTLGPGEFLGEIGALSGWPQSVTAKTRTRCTMIQIRLPALKLMRRQSADLKTRLDRAYRAFSLSAQLKSTPLFRSCPDDLIERLKDRVELLSFDPDELIAQEGGTVDAVYLVRSGFVRLAQQFGVERMTVSYLSKGMTFGEVELIAAELERWEATATSVEYAELVKIPADVLQEAMELQPDIAEQLWKSGVARIKEYAFSRHNIDHSEFTDTALSAGLVEGNSMLAIDLDVCTRCDDCVRACAATHDGRPRFVREGSKYHNLLIAKSCYHCQDPVCLVGCPTGAIRRFGAAEVVEIEEAICIGCSSCARNCPYDAIIIHETGESWPDDALPTGLRGRPRLVASKCDLCKDTGHGPACVSNCPQGCAFRVGSLDQFEQILKR